MAVVGVLCGVLAVGVAVSAFTFLNPASGVVLETETACGGGFDSGSHRLGQDIVACAMPTDAVEAGGF